MCQAAQLVTEESRGGMLIVANRPCSRCIQTALANGIQIVVLNLYQNYEIKSDGRSN